MEALEVGHLGRVTRLGERFEPGADELGDPTAEHGLLTEQVGLGFFGERGLDDARTRPTDCIGVRHGDGAGVARGILLDRDEGRHAAAFGEGTAHEMAGALRRNHDHVDAFGCSDPTEPNVETVRECERISGFEVRRNVGVVDRLLFRVGGEQHDDVGRLGRVGDVHHGEASSLGLRPRRRALPQPDDHIDA